MNWAYISETIVIGLEVETLLDFKRRRGITSIVRWNLCWVIFGVETEFPGTCLWTGQGKILHGHEVSSSLAGFVSEGVFTESLRKSNSAEISKNMSANKGLPLPLGRGVCETKSKKGAPDPENPLFLGFSVLRGGLRPWSQTMVVSEGARP